MGGTSLICELTSFSEIKDMLVAKATAVPSDITTISGQGLLKNRFIVEFS